MCAAASSCEHPRVEQIGRYELLGVLGRGASGVVYHARETSHPLRREVALKLLTAGVGAPLVVRRRFEREAAALVRLLSDRPLFDALSCNARRNAARFSPERVGAQLEDTFAAATTRAA